MLLSISRNSYIRIFRILELQLVNSKYVEYIHYIYLLLTDGNSPSFGYFFCHFQKSLKVIQTPLVFLLMPMFVIERHFKLYDAET